jgi:hypothetical protein
MDYMDKKQAVLEAIFADDPLDLLRVRPATTPARNTEDRLVAAFQEISTFWEKHHRLPLAGGGVQEHQFLSRLRNLQSDPHKVNLLQDLDQHGLLRMELPPIENTNVQEKELGSLDDIFADDTFSFFDDDTEAALFDLKHVDQASDRAEADFVAQRKPCKNFEQYEGVFKSVQKDLAGGKRKLLQFKEDNLREGKFYIHNGILLLLEEAAIEEKEEDYKSGGRTRKDGRTRVIFENGTESNMLYRSLYKALLANGKAVSDHEYEVSEELAKNFNLVTEADEASGYIYILRSKSQHPEIKALKNLYKIGYSTTPVMERIKNASKEPTYLMAEVELVSEFKCYNLNAQRFEQLLHNFFGEVCLNIDVFDHKRERRTPREWFVAPLPIIQRVIEMIVSGEIIGFRYDALKEEIEVR